MSRFVEVAVQLPVHGTYHDGVPAFAAGQVMVGRRVLVPFGSRGVTGVVVAESEEAPGEVEVRDVEALLDTEPAMGAELVELCRWIAGYYEAPLGEVIRAALPAGTRVQTASRVELTAEGQAALEGGGGAMARGAREVLGALAAGKELKGGQRRAVDELAAAGLVRLVRDVGRARVRDKTVRVAVLNREKQVTGDRRQVTGNVETVARPVSGPEGEAEVEAEVEIVEEEGGFAMPDFLGLGMAEVLELAKEKGVRVEVIGSGRAIEQFPSPGPARRSAECRVVFAHESAVSARSR